jgi:hypothetical protein
MITPFLRNAWNPSRLIDGGDMTLWLDASDSNTIVEVAGAVEEWKDKSSNNNHATQSTEASKPSTSANTLNNLNVLTFNLDYLSLSSQIANLKSAIVVASNLDGSISPSVSPLFGEEDSIVGADYVFVNVNTTDGDYDISIDGLSGNSGNASVNGGSLVSGTNIDLSQTNAQNESSNLWYCDFTNNATVDYICRANTSANDYINKGYIAEIIMFSTVLTETDRQKLEGYLTHKWGLTSKMPSNHPYKERVPVI